MQGSRGAHSLHFWASAVRAARPASLASSARTEALEAIHSQAYACEAQPKTIEARRPKHVISGAATFRVRSFHSPSAEEAAHKGRTVRPRSQILAKPGCTRRKHRLCAAAQSQMQEAEQAPAAAQHVPVACVCLQAASPNAQCGLAVVHRPLPNPSIERTLSGLRPPSASHVKR